MRNAIQHARHHIITRNNTQQKKMARMDGSRKITRGCRLRTPQRYNPWKNHTAETIPEDATNKQPRDQIQDRNQQPQTNTTPKIKPTTQTYGKP